jgi:hypothetical protein
MKGAANPEDLVHPGRLVGLELALRRPAWQAVVLAYESGVVEPGGTPSE